MSGPKIATAREAVEDAIDRLRPRTGSRSSSTTTRSTSSPRAARNARRPPARRRRARPDRRPRFHEPRRRLAARLRAGRRGTSSSSGVNRTLLLTDGLANIGITDPAELERHASELRQRGVATSTFGVGADFDERLLQAMADAGGGHFYFIESAAQIRDHMTSEVGESLDVVARGVELPDRRRPRA